MLLANHPQRPRVATRDRISKKGLDLFFDCPVGHDIEAPDLLVIRSEKVKTVEFADNLLAIGRAGAGVNNIDGGKFDEATSRGICIFNAPGANARSVAELVMTMIGANARRVFDAVSFVRTHSGQPDDKLEEYIEKEKREFIGVELEGKTLGVIGLGQVGVETANCAIQAGMIVVGFDSLLTVHNARRLTNDLRFTLAKSLEQVLSCDIITVHVPLTEKTRHLIGAREIAMMNPNVTLVNYARAGIYDDGAVISAIEAKKVSSYITDFPSKKLVNAKVYATPHIGASTPESEDRCAIMVCRQLRDFFHYGTVANSVNFPTVEAPLHPGTKTRLTIVNRDIPGMIAAYTGLLAKAGISIPNVPGDSNGKIGYFIIDVPVDVPPEILNAIHDIDGVIRVRAIPVAQ